MQTRQNVRYFACLVSCCGQTKKYLTHKYLFIFNWGCHEQFTKGFNSRINESLLAMQAYTYLKSYTG